MTSPTPQIFPHDKILDFFILRFIPHRVQPNHVTILRMILTPVVFYFILKEQYGVGVPLFLFTAFTDAIDGAMARTRNRITEWGTMMDPLADKFLIGSVLILLAVRYVQTYIVAAVIVIELLFIGGAIAGHVHGHKARPANLWGKIKMLLQVVAVFLILLGLVYDYPAMIQLASFVFGGAIMFALMSLFSHKSWKSNGD